MASRSGSKKTADGDGTPQIQTRRMAARVNQSQSPGEQEEEDIQDAYDDGMPVADLVDQFDDLAGQSAEEDEGEDQGETDYYTNGDQSEEEELAPPRPRQRVAEQQPNQQPGRRARRADAQTRAADQRRRPVVDKSDLVNMPIEELATMVEQGRQACNRDELRRRERVLRYRMGVTDSEGNDENVADLPRNRTRRIQPKKISWQQNPIAPAGRIRASGDNNILRPALHLNQIHTRQHREHREDPYSSDGSMTSTGSGAGRRHKRRTPNIPIRTFEGKNWQAFLSQFETVCALNQVPDNEKVFRLQYALAGEALSVLVKGKVWTYDLLVKALDKKYGQTRSELEVRTSLSNMVRQADETVIEFADKLTTLACTGGLDPDENEETLYSAFLTGLKNFPDVQVEVVKECPNKILSEAVDVASTYELLHGRRSSELKTKHNWGLVAAITGHDINKPDSPMNPNNTNNVAKINSATSWEATDKSQLMERLVKVEKENEKMTVVVKLFKDDVAAVRREHKTTNDTLLQFKARYDENEMQRTAYLDRKHGGGQGQRGGHNGGGPPGGNRGGYRGNGGYRGYQGGGQSGQQA